MDCHKLPNWQASCIELARSNQLCIVLPTIKPEVRKRTGKPIPRSSRGLGNQSLPSLARRWLLRRRKKRM